jgi:DNA polymerase
MVADKSSMGGEYEEADTAELRSALRWWLEAGVDAAIAEQPRNWLKPAPQPAGSEQAPPKEQTAQFAPVQTPDTLEGYRQWLFDCPSLPFASAGARRIFPVGPSEARIMLLADMPPMDGKTEDGPIAGDAWHLMIRMLAAIGLRPEDAYRASLSCFSTHGSFRGPELQACAEIARRHIAVVKPASLLLLGDAPCRALLGKPLAAARGHVQKIEGVRTVATFHPSFLLMHPLQKEAAWADLLLLTEEQ